MRLFVPAVVWCRLVQDASGGLWKLDTDSGDVEKIVAGHAGPVFGLDVSPVDHFAASAGQDGTVRCWDYVDKSMLFTARHQQAATALRWMPTSLDSTGRCIAVGFSDGVVRVFWRAKTEWKRYVALGIPPLIVCSWLLGARHVRHSLQVAKPHTSSVTALEFAPSGRMAATGSSDGTVFLFRISELDHDVGRLPNLECVVPRVPRGPTLCCGCDFVTLTRPTPLAGPLAL